MNQLSALIRKEVLLLNRDIHSLLVLFVMPVVFILIMSLALQEEFASRSGAAIELLVINQEPSDAASSFLQHLSDDYPLVLIDADSRASAMKLLRSDSYPFVLEIKPELDSQLLLQERAGPAVILHVAPATSKASENILQGALRESLALLRMDSVLEEVEATVDDFEPEVLRQVMQDDSIIAVEYGYQQQQQSVAPSSVQQNVPAWMVFAVFFVVVPLSNTFINERQQGTLRRLSTMNVKPRWVFAGKLLPYFVINQVQVLLMIAVGLYLMPLLGGERLTLGDSPLALLLMSSAVSMAALGYALLIASVANSSEQAVTLGGTGNIILGALGGIMVPKFVMPEFMQQWTMLSPMSWGLEGFLDVFLRSGGVAQVLEEALALTVFGCLALLLAINIFNHKNK